MNKLSIYIHIPFCKTICVYCGFLTYANKEKRINDYTNALLREISGKAYKYRKDKIVSIYFGGGTPSLLAADKIEQILDKIREEFTVEKNAEITIECNPESTTPEKLKIYKDIGISRISLGIQSLNAKTLWRVARVHSRDDVEKALGNIERTGFTNFGVDYIIGLPYQTISTFKMETARILTFKPPHLSFYFLSHDTNKIDLISDDCPTEKTQVAMYKWLVSTLEKKGYCHYEVSNYSLPGFECKHNLRYWHQEEYLGLGLGAHSYLHDTCMVNEENLEKYIANPLLITEKMHLDHELKRLDYIMLNIRTAKGIDLAKYQRFFGDSKNLIKNAEPHLKSGLLARTGNRLYATNKGFLFIDHITKTLL